MAKPKIFVSHSTLDNEFATKLVNHLNAAEAQAWMDTNDAGAGNFQQRINDALADCEWFLLVLTRNALASSWVRQEVDAANRLKNQGKIKDLIFIKAGDVDHRELPPLWGVYNIFDATGDYTNAVIRVLKGVGLISQPEIAPSIPSWYPTYSLGAIGGVAAGAAHEVGHIEHGIAAHIPGHHNAAQQKDTQKGGHATEAPKIEHGIAAHIPGHHSASVPAQAAGVANWICRNCNESNPADKVYCRKCGAPRS